MELLQQKITHFLKEAQRQFVKVAISNKNFAWSREFFNVNDIKEFNNGHATITMLILMSSRDSCCVNRFYQHPCTEI
jgi:hypothetical protein